MDRYSVELQFTKEFPIDVKGLCKWADFTLGLKMEQATDNWILFYKESALTSTEDENYKSDEHKQLHEYYDALIEVDEATALSLPSRLSGLEYRTWLDAKKAEIVAVTDYSTLSAEQKKLWMGLELTDEEKDSLGA